jgi:type II secretory pathway component PulJ
MAGLIARRLARRVAGVALFALAIAFFLFNLRRQAERAGRAAERLQNLERTHAIQRQMLDAVSHRPRNRDDLLERLREGRF